LTPHQKELERLIGKWDSEEEKFEKTIAFSLHYDVIVVMKGAPTHIIDAEKCTGILQEMRLWPQPEAEDVLTGIITSLLAQSYEPVDCCCFGCVPSRTSG
jgi:NAD(P)H-hydrate repair Nnr-like enzyme with NAD(P)H-hydrate dehydratase domain